ncbi:MAG: hypothetical protein ACFFBY_15650, partial [Promethearchaeota archaeon]
FDKTYKGEIDTWDYQWVYAVFQNSGLSIIPNTNLVKNIGVNAAGTHTYSSNDPLSEMQSFSIKKITHPTFILPQKEAELYTLREICNIKPQKIKNKIFKKLKIF